MNPEIKKQWLEALRSGEYKQGIRHLRTPQDSFCCLGVLCDIHARVANKTWGVDDNKTPVYMGYGAFPPDEVLEWAGLDAEGAGAIVYTLADRNDKGDPFSVLANLIQDQL